MAEIVDVVVETPRGSCNKYAVDEGGVIRFDRRLPRSVAFPADYGFVPGATGTDGEPLDALALLLEPAFPGIRVSARAVGVYWLDTGGRREAKLICLPEGEPAYDGIDDMADLPDYVRSEIANFFDIYRMLDPGKECSVVGSEGADGAKRVLAEAADARARQATGD
jgi:inorganic pyrophosphatase